MQLPKRLHELQVFVQSLQCHRRPSLSIRYSFRYSSHNRHIAVA